MQNDIEQLIFEKSRSGRRAFAQAPQRVGDVNIPDAFRRTDKPNLPEASELQVVRHFTRLSQKNFSIDTQFYPLGSCTMKYNPRACNALALLPGFAGRHPLGPTSHGQGFLKCMFELQEMLTEVTGMKAPALWALLSVLSLASLIATPALAVDVVVKLGAGDSFVVDDNAGAIERLNVEEATGK